MKNFNGSVVSEYYDDDTYFYMREMSLSHDNQLLEVQWYKSAIDNDGQEYRFVEDDEAKELEEQRTTFINNNTIPHTISLTHQILSID